MDRRALLRSAPVALATPWGAAAGASGPTAGVLRVAFAFAETGFDPPQVSDNSSIRVLSHIFESPLTYDALARPARLVPQTAAALPEVSADHRRWVFTLRPGIFFAEHPAFGGRPRELVAADYVYSIKRYYDPKLRSEHLYQFENAGLLGLSELRRKAMQAKTPFPYDTEVEGLRALDRYRFEVRLAAPEPRLAYLFASPQFTGAVAREVVERHADDLMAHPVGTGPFRLVQWRRASRIVLERNPGFRDQRSEASPPDDDADAQAVARLLRGRRLPLLDRVEVDVIEEAQPRWLAFLGGQIDVLTPVPAEFAPLALPGGRLAPFLQRRGVQLHRTLTASTTHTFFNLDDPIVGGYAPEQVALRRAVALAYDHRREIRLVLGGEAEPARGLIPPHCTGHQPATGAAGVADPARAAALLDTWGWVDRNGDGWRERPDGSPLTLRLASTTTQRARQTNELWQKSLNAVGLRIAFEVAPFGQLIRRALAGQLMMWGFTWGAANPDGDFYLGLGYGPNAEQSNDARFRLPAYDRVYERQRRLPDGPERLAAMQEAARWLQAYMPYVAHHHLYAADLAQPHVLGHRRHPFANDWWRHAAVASPPNGG